jgi:DNA-binding response OmpR family regulator
VSFVWSLVIIKEITERLVENNNYKTLSILCVEDDDFIRQNQCEYLNRIFANVYEATNGIEGYSLYEQHHPDIILTDIKMPLMDGLEMATKIRQSDKRTQMIVFTAFTQTDYLLRAVELQLVKYLSKPVEEKTLLDALEQCSHNLLEGNSNIILLSEETVFDTYNKTLFIKSKPIHLTKSERLFMELVTKHRNRVVVYQEIENYIWSEKGMSDDALRSMIRALRKKVPQLAIENLSGVGYRLHCK